MTDSARITDAVTEAAKMTTAPTSLEDTLDALVRAALNTVPGFNHVGISVTHRNDGVETKAGTDPFVWEIDELQYGLRQGPCYETLEGAALVVVEDAAQEQRWPDYISQAVEKGLRSQMGLRLSTDDNKTLGGLNLYSTESASIPDEALQIAELFAAHAAIALGRSQREGQLSEAVATRKVIGQAIGIIMERYQISEDRAFQFLVRASSASNIKLNAVARELVDTSNDRFTQH